MLFQRPGAVNVQRSCGVKAPEHGTAALALVHKGGGLDRPLCRRSLLLCFRAGCSRLLLGFFRLCIEVCIFRICRLFPAVGVRFLWICRGIQTVFCCVQLFLQSVLLLLHIPAPAGQSAVVVLRVLIAFQRYAQGGMCPQHQHQLGRNLLTVHALCSAGIVRIQLCGRQRVGVRCLFRLLQGFIYGSLPAAGQCHCIRNVLCQLGRHFVVCQGLFVLAHGFVGLCTAQVGLDVVRVQTNGLCKLGHCLGIVHLGQVLLPQLQIVRRLGCAGCAGCKQHCRQQKNCREPQCRTFSGFRKHFKIPPFSTILPTAAPGVNAARPIWHCTQSRTRFVQHSTQQKSVVLLPEKQHNAMVLINQTAYRGWHRQPCRRRHG